VIARTRYEWGEEITTRHALQYSWALLTAAALVLQAFPRLLRRVFLPLLAFTLAIKCFDLHSRMHTDRVEYGRTVSDDGALLEVVRAEPEEALILSDAAPVLRAETARRVHVLGQETPSCDAFAAALCRTLSQFPPKAVTLTGRLGGPIGDCLEDRSSLLPLEDVEVIVTSSSVIARGSSHPSRSCRAPG
jgi:hypothetical protein